LKKNENDVKIGKYTIKLMRLKKWTNIRNRQNDYANDGLLLMRLYCKK